MQSGDKDAKKRISELEAELKSRMEVEAALASKAKELLLAVATVRPPPPSDNATPPSPHRT
jgi:hypothetical protein